MGVFVNRSLNLKRIKLIGFDMDYTLVNYDADAFERLTFTKAIEYLVDNLDYPSEIRELEFDFQRAIVGLVLDKRNGYLLKLNCHGKVKLAWFGLEELDYRERNRIYQNTAIDLHDLRYQSLDTSFAISFGVLFSELVELKKRDNRLPDYRQLASDVNTAIDAIHRDGTLKSILRENFDKYVVRDPNVAAMLERYRDYDKRLMIITNSDFLYTRSLLDYAINPYLKKHRHWSELFEVVITYADKPRFFERKNRFLRVNPESGAMSNHEGALERGIYQGGWFRQIELDLGVSGNEILYIGDHIYGDVVSIKKYCGWRTALVIGDLEAEMVSLEKAIPIQREIDELMAEKSAVEREFNRVDLLRHQGRYQKRAVIDALIEKSEALNNRISELVVSLKGYFNPWWGEVLRAGAEESRFADQLERYACIYMTKVSDLYDFSPRTYFRPQRRMLPHEMEVYEKDHPS